MNVDTSTVDVAGVCAACGGVGSVPSVEWVAFRKHRDGDPMSTLSAAEYFVQRLGFGEVPPEHDECVPCEGTGRVVEAVTVRDLVDAVASEVQRPVLDLRDLGDVEKPLLAALTHHAGLSNGVEAREDPSVASHHLRAVQEAAAALGETRRRLGPGAA